MFEILWWIVGWPATVVGTIWWFLRKSHFRTNEYISQKALDDLRKK